jgi:hypothetical protein
MQMSSSMQTGPAARTNNYTYDTFASSTQGTKLENSASCERRHKPFPGAVAPQLLYYTMRDGMELKAHTAIPGAVAPQLLYYTMRDGMELKAPTAIQPYPKHDRISGTTASTPPLPNPGLRPAHLRYQTLHLIRQELKTAMR